MCFFNNNLKILKNNKMNYSDLIQFKDEVLKNLRELEKKIMSKVNKNQEDISSDLNTINQSLNFMRTSSNSMIDSIAEQKLNSDKILVIEADLKKFNTALNSQEKKINENMIEISYIREQYEKSLSDSLMVPGIIGKNCKYKTFNDFVISSNNEVTKLKNEKEYSKKESRDLKQKLEQSIKSVSSLVDSFTNRSKLYTDGTKKAIIQLIETKTSELDTKNLELLAKMCKVETELEEKLKIFEDNLKEFNTSKNEQFQKLEDKLLLMNNQIETMDKNLKETKEELNSFKNKEKNDINEIKNDFNNIIKPENNDNNNENNNNKNNNNNNDNIEINNIYNTSNNITDKKEINIFNKSKNLKEIQNFSRNNKYHKTFSQSRSNFNNRSKTALYNKTPNNLNTSSYSNDNDNNQINNNISKKNTNSNINTQKSIIEKEALLAKAKIKNFENVLNKEKPLIKFNNNNIKNAILARNHLSKNIKFSNPEFINFKSNNNKKIPTESFHEEDIISRNLEKNFDLINKPIDYNKRNFYNYGKNPSLKREKDFFLSNKKNQKEKNITININENNTNFNLKRIKFPIIEEKLIKNVILTNEGIFNRKNNTLNKGKSISPHKIKLIKAKNKKPTNMKYSIDKETGVGCNIVKLSIEDDSITPYNTNGLLTMASKNMLKRRLIGPEESMSFSFDNIFSNIFQYQGNRNIVNKKKPLCSKTVHAFFGNDKTDFKNILNSIDDNIKNEMAKTIQL